MKLWYDGYHTAAGTRMYNPRSVVYALTNNCLASYWTGSGQYAEIASYIAGDAGKIEGLKDDVIMMAAGEAVPANLEEYASTAMNVTTKEEVFSTMVVYGFLNYEDGCVQIPNRELMDEFTKTIQKESSYSYVRELEKESERVLQATLSGNTGVIEEVLEFVHHSESPLKSYNNEAELSGSIKLAYIAARNKYDIQRLEAPPRFAQRQVASSITRNATHLDDAKDQSGIGYVDYIFYPYNKKDDGIIIELKVNDSAENAIKQIKNKKYASKFKGKLGERPKTTGRILAVGIGYYKKDKVHRCKIETL